MLADDFLHHGNESAPFSPAALELFQLACQRHRFGILLRLHQQPDQVRDLLQTRRMLLKKLPNQRLRIAQVAPLAESVPPKLYGGTERVVSWLTEELVSLGHDVTLFATGDSVTSAQLVPVGPRAIRTLTISMGG